ncbi:hypothetical protein MIN45_P2058 [Methylomarinovum tepidoasis]|uniref:HMA domain-containing protein n=1 Tax=Methylomarinovum tepidoasis TaxID=2840183 RepID=A0AAU9CAY6_9GAMM|nr:sulfite exporter TauE/SafE family protein [Methylomarinovum sp. IN45]BCX89685.1 hypothetical protein MIN45_P2058 [Methylomarinovum sp. IN45]
MAETSVQIKVTGMHCSGCEKIIEDTVGALPCVSEAQASFTEGTLSLRYDAERCSLEHICKALEPKGYTCVLAHKRNGARCLKALFSVLGLVALAAAIYAARRYGHALSLPTSSPGMSDWLVLTVGLVTGFHCIGMCGGFVLSYTQATLESGRSPYMAHLLYGVGKTLSYTLFGAVFGGLGALVSFTPWVRGLTALVAGLFLVGFGLNMLGGVDWFRRLMFRQPKAVEKLTRWRRSRNPFVIGFLTGFMFACGPLQAMYILAAGTADPVEGAKVMFLFGIGTLPALLGFGVFATYLSGWMMRGFLRLSGILVIALGVIMMIKGWQKGHIGDYLPLIWRQMQAWW